MLSRFYIWLPAMFLLTQVPELSVSIMMPLAYLVLLMIGAAKAISYSPVIVLGQTYLAKRKDPKKLQ